MTDIERDNAAALASADAPPAEAQPDEGLYRAALKELLTPKPLQMTALLFIGLLVLFVLGQFEGLKSLPGIAVLLAVILVHELGHAAGMRAFGYRDVRMFFIPFFGAAASGRPRGVAAWKDALVSLLGPVPGIALAWAGFVLSRRYPVDALLSAVQVLLILNAFNLLPLGALDGGRFLQRVLFCRHRVLEVGFLALGTLVLGLIALRTSSWALLAFAAFGLVTLPTRWRVLGAASSLGGALVPLQGDPGKLDEGTGRALFDAARGTLAGATAPSATVAANTMEAILDASRRPPGVLATLGLLGVYGASGVAALVLGILVISFDRPVSWRPVEEAGIKVDLPQEPFRSEVQSLTPAGPRPKRKWQAVVQGTRRFTVQIVDAGEALDPKAWVDFERDQLGSETLLKLESERPIELSGNPGREVQLRNDFRVARARIVVVGQRLFLAVASAPEWQPDQQRFLDSFALVPPRVEGTAPVLPDAGGAAP